MAMALIDKGLSDGRVALNLGYRFASPENWGFSAIRSGKSTGLWCPAWVSL